MDEQSVGRRDVVAGGVAVGFALAAQPIAAQTLITTDADGLDAAMIEVPSFDRSIPAYRARPRGSASAPLVILIHEIFGLHEHIRDLCRRLAKAGYCAIAPDLYVRQGDVSTLPDIPSVLKIVTQVPDSQVARDLDATFDIAAKEGADPARAAVTGFCWGGRQTWLYAAHNSRLKAAAAWYGPLQGPTNAERPKNPVDVAAVLTVPVLGLYGGQDQGIPQAQIDAMKAALEGQTIERRQRSEIRLFPDAPHGFNADYRPSYRREDALVAWSSMLGWFQSHGAA